MTELTTITEVSKLFDISTRTLRYYEETGLIKSSHMDGYSYRAYDEQTIKNLQQILILRKLNLSLKQIRQIFSNDDAAFALDVFMSKAEEIGKEVEALNAVKSVLEVLIAKIKSTMDFSIDEHLAQDKAIVKILDSLNPSENLKEKKMMKDAEKAINKKETITDFRIIYLPPAVVASSHFIGPEPEDTAGRRIREFVSTSSLTEAKPDLRVYGFNNPNPQGEEEYGYELWVTIPEDMKVDEPLVKKSFGGGLYAAYTIKMGDFHLWKPFYESVMESEEYDYDPREPLSMGGTMEEHLNAYGFYSGNEEESKYIQLDLLIPIKEK
ncbi:MAG: effector binding domain-containing protein [Clostridia bacterium]|nr:effector binding domain-containing protein [Clostridia bacterium]